MNRKTTSILSVILGLTVLSVIIYLIGPGAIYAQFRSLGWFGFLILAGFIILTHVFWTAAWFVILKGYGKDLPYGLCFWANICSFSVTFLTPSMHFGGEPVKAAVVVRETELTYSEAFATIAAELMMMMATLVSVILAGLVFGLYTRLPTDALVYLILFSVVVTGFLLSLLMNFIRGFYAFTKITGFLKRKLPWTDPLERAENWIRGLEEEVAHIFGNNRKYAWGAFFISLLATGTMVLRPQIYFFFAEGTFFSIGDLALIYALNSVLSAIFWVTPGGMGISEGGFIGIFAILGLSSSAAVAYSFSIQAVQWLITGVGLTLLVRYGIMNLLIQQIRGKKDGQAPPQA